MLPLGPGPHILVVGEVVGQPLSQAQAQMWIHYVHACEALPTGQRKFGQAAEQVFAKMRTRGLAGCLLGKGEKGVVNLGANAAVTAAAPGDSANMPATRLGAHT